LGNVLSELKPGPLRRQSAKSLAPAKLIEIATHFAQTRQALAALEPDDPRAADLARQAKEAFDAGQLAEADTRLERAKALEAAALGEADADEPRHRALDAGRT
jgi:hypothetical protein